MKVVRAASIVLDSLVRRAGKEPFVDYARSVQLKHFDDDTQEIIELDVDECALAAILKALANYVHIPEYKRDLVLAFKVWVKQNLDPQRYNIDCNPTWSPPPSAA